jgi:hypothetical protein
MKYRNLISLLAAQSFIVLFVSSIILYLVPDRKVASWGDWRFMGLDKQQWDNLHINLGILFLIVVIWHIYLNLKSIKHYLKVKRKLVIFTKEFTFAFFIIIFFSVGTIVSKPPMELLVRVGNAAKAIYSFRYGHPPFGYAEYTSLEDFCLLTSIDFEEAKEKLKVKSFKKISSIIMLKDLASENHSTPKKIYEILRGDSPVRYLLPLDIPIGIAHRTFDEIAVLYSLDMDRIAKHMEHHKIMFHPKSSFRANAIHNHIHPAQLYNMLRASQATPKTLLPQRLAKDI